VRDALAHHEPYEVNDPYSPRSLSLAQFLHDLTLLELLLVFFRLNLVRLCLAEAIRLESLSRGSLPCSHHATFPGPYRDLDRGSGIGNDPMTACTTIPGPDTSMILGLRGHRILKFWSPGGPQDLRYPRSCGRARPGLPYQSVRGLVPRSGTALATGRCETGCGQ